MIEARRHVDRTLGHLNHFDLRKDVPDRGAFVITVVDENHRFQSDIEFLRQRHQVVGLRLPVHLERGEMLVTQHLMRVVAQQLVDVAGIVLAAQREDQTALLEIEDPALEIDVGRAGVLGAEPDAFLPILSEDSTPQRVVGVQREHLCAWRLEQDADVDHPACDFARGFGSERKLCGIPEAAIEESVAPDLLKHVVEVEEQGVGDGFPHRSADVGAQRRPPRKLGAIRGRVVTSQSRT